jgi:hypothetical protein
MNPGALFPDVGHFKKVGIESCGVNGLAVSRFVHSRGASRHDDAVNAVVSDVVLNHVLAGIGAHILIISRDGNVGKGFGECRHLLDIDRCRNINSTMTDENADLHDTTKIGVLERWSVGMMGIEED